MPDKLSIDDIKTHAKAFWESVDRQWSTLYKAIYEGTDGDRQRVLQLLHYFAGPLTDHIDFEITLGELNRVVFDASKAIVELYISPRLLLTNVPIMEALISHQRKIDKLQVFRYRSYNTKDPLIANIEYENAMFEYTDFGCQHFSGVSETKQPIINIVIYVRKNAANKLLTQKEVTFVGVDKQETKLLKWLPTKTNVVDVLLTNIIGEYNLIHRTGYIEFLPEADPLITAGSVFTELADLRGAYTILDKATYMVSCVVCNRKSYQIQLQTCSKCKKVKYCCKTCQLIDYPTHKLMCKVNE